ncbi:CDP-alcohol phosphatidyltransferase family protein [Leifsonia sp. Leaf264]|uniref:CDP-alcohol phosphatidyltransferase family protein n=1 Tax=Leifsonia sp. Leaf264 TaxID=1736314 RepID=UPI0006FDBC6E|nr:CDP-alcohol phosphatidyltransferase family protein [Leifsonia sp. Leaf264]KQO97538.1 hypothetical protein ASF30_14020 [Leifsonia sp. Leaf264]
MSDPEQSTFSTRFVALKAGQKKRGGVPLYTLMVNRPVGRVIAAASPAAVTPNGLTAIGGVLTYGALVLLMTISVVAPWTVAVGLLLIIGFFFDSADGQLARLRRRGSLSGEWLDHVLDCGRIVLMHLATLVYLLRTGMVSSVFAVVLCTVFAVAAAVVFFGGTLFEKLVVVPGVATTTVERSARANAIRSAVMLPVDYGVLCWVYLLLPLGLVFVWVYAALALAKLVTTSSLLLKWYRSLRAIDDARLRDAERARP